MLRASPNWTSSNDSGLSRHQRDFGDGTCEAGLDFVRACIGVNPRVTLTVVDVPAVDYKELRGSSAPEGSAQIRERVVRAREVQLNRFAAAKERSYCNAQMTSRQIRTYCELSTDCERLLERAMTQQGLSARAHDRILKVARTIADLEGVPHIEFKHIAQAIQYRTLDRTYWA